jgi:hypothetical protein
MQARTMLRSRESIRGKMRGTNEIQKSIFALRIKQDYNRKTEVTALPLI